MPHSNVTISILETGRVLTAFDRYSIDLSMFTQGNPFTLSTWATDASESAWRTLMLETKHGHRVNFAIEGQSVFTGWIETIDVDVARNNGSTLVISGRDLAAPAIDWDVNPTMNVAGLTLDEALYRAFNHVGLETVTGSGADAAALATVPTASRGATSRWRRRRVVVSPTRPEKGETIMRYAQRLVEKLGYMMWLAPLADGTLGIIVDVPAYDSEPLFKFERRFSDAERRQLTPESNILASKYSAQIRTIPTTVSAYGRAPRGDRLPARTRSSFSARSLLELGQATDFRLYTDLRSNTVSGVVREVNQRNAQRAREEQQAGFHIRSLGTGARSRNVATRVTYTNTELARWACVASPMPPHPRHLHDKRATDPRTGEQAARRVMAKAMKDFRRYEVTVRGHSQRIDGRERVYSLNTMARVYDGRTYLDEHMLITDIRFDGSRDGAQETRITLGTQGAIDLSPEPTP